MSTIKTILLFLRRTLLFVLIAYWMGFIGFTIEKLAAGGLRAVVGFYIHIAGAPFEWNWKVFLAQQLTILAITLVLCFFEWRLLSARRAADGHGVTR